jgi:hypothetical protein
VGAQKREEFKGGREELWKKAEPAVRKQFPAHWGEEQIEACMSFWLEVGRTPGKGAKGCTHSEQSVL